MNLMFPHLLQTTETEPLILPDSVQKAHLAEAIDKVIHLDLKEVIMNLADDAVWIVVKLLIALAIYTVGHWLIRRAGRLLDALLERRRIDPSLRSFLKHTTRIVLLIILILCVIQTLGVNVTSIIALFASATLAIGMALSGTAQNFAGGVMILLLKPYRVGDYIEAQGQSGTVKEIKLFSTVIRTVDNQTIYIPNNSIATAIINNYSTADLRRVEWTVGISYGDSVDVAREAILDLMKDDPRIVPSPAPAVWVVALADSSVNLSARAWVKNADYWDVFFEYNEKIYKTLPERGISFPFPQMDVHVKRE